MCVGKSFSKSLSTILGIARLLTLSIVCVVSTVALLCLTVYTCFNSNLSAQSCAHSTLSFYLNGDVKITLYDLISVPGLSSLNAHELLLQFL